MAFYTCLLEEYADRAMNIRIGRSFPDIKVIKAFFGIIKAADGIQVFLVVFAYFSRELIVFFWGKGIIPAGNTRLEEKGLISVGFVMISIDIRLPFMKGSHPSHRFGMLEQQIIAVQVEPIVICPSSRPCFAEFP